MPFLISVDIKEGDGDLRINTGQIASDGWVGEDHAAEVIGAYLSVDQK